MSARSASQSAHASASEHALVVFLHHVPRLGATLAGVSQYTTSPQQATLQALVLTSTHLPSQVQPLVHVCCWVLVLPGHEQLTVRCSCAPGTHCPVLSHLPGGPESTQVHSLPHFRA
jgi:hypothetical protein